MLNPPPNPHSSTDTTQATRLIGTEQATANLVGEAEPASTGTVILGLDPGIQCQELNTDTMQASRFLCPNLPTANLVGEAAPASTGTVILGLDPWIHA